MATIFSDPHVSSFGHRRESGWSGMIYPSVNSRFLFPIISCLCPKIESMRTCSSIQVGQPWVDCFVFLKMDVAFTFLQLLVLSPNSTTTFQRWQKAAWKDVGHIFSILDGACWVSKICMDQITQQWACIFIVQPPFHISMQYVRYERWVFGMWGVQGRVFWREK